MDFRHSVHVFLFYLGLKRNNPQSKSQPSPPNPLFFFSSFLVCFAYTGCFFFLFFCVCFAVLIIIFFLVWCFSASKNVFFFVIVFPVCFAVLFFFSFAVFRRKIDDSYRSLVCVLTATLIFFFSANRTIPPIWTREWSERRSWSRPRLRGARSTFECCRRCCTGRAHGPNGRYRRAVPYVYRSHACANLRRSPR